MNSTPMTIPRGIQDLGARTLPPETPPVPTFFPHIFTFAAKGPTGEPFPMVGSAVTSNFGTEVFDDGSDYATHQSVAARLINATGCAQMWQRVVAKELPASMTNKGYTNAALARMVLWIEVSEQTPIQQYARKTNGTYTTTTPTALVDSNNVPVKTMGRNIRWVVTNDLEDGTASGPVGHLDSYTMAAGGPANEWHKPAGKDTTRYPIMEIVGRGEGSHYNKCGVRLWPCQSTDVDAPTSATLRDSKAFFYKMAFVRRAKPTTTPVLVTTGDMRTSLTVSLEPNQRNSDTGVKISADEIFSDAYSTKSDPIIYGDIGDVFVYHDNVQTVTRILFNTERAFGQGGDAAEIPQYNTNNSYRHTDFSATDDTHASLINLLTAKSFKGVPYFTVALETDFRGSVMPSSETNMMLSGGDDGTMNLEVFDYLVKQEALKYADPTNVYMNRARFDQSCLIDTGFGVETKNAMTNIIALRKDTYFIGTPIIVGDPDPDLDTEKARAVSLRTMLQVLPESDYYGTQAVRGILVARSGELISSEYPHRLPLVIEVVEWCAKMMGASNGKWNSKYLFDIQPNNTFKRFRKISNSWTPTDVRTEDWLTAGMNFPLDSDRTKCYMPGFRTIYAEETSPLTSAFVVMACAEVQKVMERTHAELTGAVRYTGGQLVEEANRRIAAKTFGRFAGLFQIKPNCYISDGDELRGYSWSMLTEVYANNMKTAATVDLSLFRMSDYVA